ncbi:MAG: YybH family protein [Sphingomicrobium sp.]
MVRSILAMGLAAALLAGCDSAPEPADPAALEQQILAKEEEWNRAFERRDADALAGFFADDAAMAQPGEQLVRGKESIRKATEVFAEDPNLNVTFRANRVQVAGSGDLAYTRGQYMLTSTNPSTDQPQSTRGYYLTVWQKQPDDSWKVVEDFITPGPPLPVAERATMIE